MDQLEKELCSQMPTRKKITIHKPYSLGWKKGEVYTFQIKSKVEKYEDYIGWYVLFYVEQIEKRIGL